MSAEYNDCLYRFATAYLSVYEEAMPSDIIDAMLELRPE